MTWLHLDDGGRPINEAAVASECFKLAYLISPRLLLPAWAGLGSVQLSFFLRGQQGNSPERNQNSDSLSAPHPTSSKPRTRNFGSRCLQ